MNAKRHISEVYSSWSNYCTLTETDKKALSDAHDIRLDLVNGELAAINQKFIDLQMAADEQSGTLGSDSVIKRQNAKDATLKMEQMHELEMRKFHLEQLEM